MLKIFFISLIYMARKYLAPNGKTYTEAQLDRLSMKNVFDLLVKLDVADRSMYRDFKAEQRDESPSPSRSRRKTRSRTKTRYVYRRRSPSPPRYQIVYRPRSRSPPRFRVQYRPRPAIRPGPKPGLYRSPSRVQARARLRQLAGPGPVMQRTAPRILPTNPAAGNRCARMGLVMCPDNQCATSYANCN